MKLAGLVYTSNESLEDANAAEGLGQALARRLAIKADASIFEAGGPPAPIGLAGIAGIDTVDASPTSSLDPYATAIGQLEASGANATVIFMAPDAGPRSSPSRRPQGPNVRCSPHRLSAPPGNPSAASSGCP